MKKWNKKAVPLLAGTKISHDRIAVWCPYCREYHVHGWYDEKDSDASHRVQHCTSIDSPFKKSGYYIAVVKKYVDLQ